MRENFTLARERLGIVTLIIGEAVGSAIAVIFYFTFLVPFALISIFSTNPLQKKLTGEQFWLNREPVSTTLEKAKRQG